VRRHDVEALGGAGLGADADAGDELHGRDEAEVVGEATLEEVLLRGAGRSPTAGLLPAVPTAITLKQPKFGWTLVWLVRPAAMTLSWSSVSV
jgi:hypothetical protein